MTGVSDNCPGVSYFCAELFDSMKSLYMTAIVPPKMLGEEIRALQQEFAVRYGSAAALRPPVHLTFSPPEYLDEEEFKEYKAQLERVCKATSPFEIELRGFGFFVKNRVVFIEAASGASLLKIVHSFRHARNKVDSRPYHPHITIGYRNILPEVFEKIMTEYFDKQFSGGFTIDQLEIWKYDQKNWKTIEQLPFQ